MGAYGIGALSPARVLAAFRGFAPPKTAYLGPESGPRLTT